jgi:hypothetical protein
MSMGGRATGIHLLVRLARRRYGAKRSVEGLLLGLAAGGGTLAAAVLSGATLASPDAFALAALSGVLCAVTWLYEGRRSQDEMARRIDGGLASGGAFLTAYECEQRAAGPLEGALVARVHAAVGPRDVRRTISPPSVAFAAAPLFAAALVFLALEHGPDPALVRARPALRALAAELGAAAAGSAAPAGDPVAELAAEAARLAPGSSAAPELAGALRELRADLARASAEAPSAALERADELAAGVLADLTGAPADERPRPAAGGGAAESLAQGEARSTMGGSSPAAGDASEASVAPEAAVAEPGAGAERAGVIAGRWWDERYDAIVTAWIESNER